MYWFCEETKGLRQLHADSDIRGVQSAIADKLRKLLFALETAEGLHQLRRFPGWKLHPLKGDLKGSGASPSLEISAYH